MKDPADRIWAYLHNELSAEEKAAFRRVLKNDPALRQAVEHSRAVDSELKALLPAFDKEIPVDNLEDLLLTAWDEEHPEYGDDAPPARSSRRILYFAAPLAAAAALALIVSLPMQTGPIHWQRIVTGTAPQLRGTEQNTLFYTPADLKQLGSTLSQAIDNAYPDRGKSVTDWVLQIHLQELAEGALTVEVSGYPSSDPARSRVWNESFQTLENFRTEVPTFGKRIADDLAAGTD
ncbi:MAG: anti-sigma factor [Kiritimatiellales bacterium]